MKEVLGVKMAVCLSIIMGAYNAEKTIAESIESICAQTFTDFELIIIDDGSQDNTYRIIDSYAIHDSRIKVLRNKNNEGIPFTLNQGIKICSGLYIARQDADDFSHPNRFEKQINFLESNPEYSMVGCWAEMFDQKGTWGLIKMKKFPTKIDFIWDIPFINASLVYRSKIIREVEGYTTSLQTKKRSEDYEILIRIYASGHKGYNISEVLYYYRVGKSDYKRRRIVYRIYEAAIRFKGFKKLKLPLYTYIFVLKPLIVALIPKSLIFLLHRIRFRK